MTLAARAFLATVRTLAGRPLTADERDQARDAHGKGWTAQRFVALLPRA